MKEINWIGNYEFTHSSDNHAGEGIEKTLDYFMQDGWLLVTKVFLQNQTLLIWARPRK